MLIPGIIWFFFWVGRRLFGSSSSPAAIVHWAGGGPPNLKVGHFILYRQLHLIGPARPTRHCSASARKPAHNWRSRNSGNYHVGSTRRRDAVKRPGNAPVTDAV